MLGLQLDEGLSRSDILGRNSTHNSSQARGSAIHLQH